MPYTPVLATLGYVLSPDGKSVLMMHRNTRPDDEHYGKYNGLGGKMEPHENIVGAMRREIYEEAGIEALDMVLRGSINWPEFGASSRDWIGFIFRIDRWRGTPTNQTDEGTLEWVAMDNLMDLNLWPGDRYFLPLVFGEDPRQFHGMMRYHEGQPISWEYTLI
jgi:8-oxo-dGTP diphosphatase